MERKKNQILSLNLKMSYQIASYFGMCIDISKRIAGKEDRPSLIIEDPLRAPKIAQNIYFLFLHFGPYMKKMVFKLFPLVEHMSPLW